MNVQVFGSLDGMPHSRSPEPRWLEPDQLHDWRYVSALLMTLPPALDSQLRRDAGMNLFEYHVLVRLSDAPGRSLPMSELARLAQGSASRLSHAARRLETAGWIERRTPADGTRGIHAHLTADGLRHLQRAAPAHVAEVRRLVVDALTTDELQALGVAARAIVATVAPDVAEGIADLDGATAD